MKMFKVELGEGHDSTKGLEALESTYMEHVYASCKYNQSKAARALGLSRATFRYKMKFYFKDKYI